MDSTARKVRGKRFDDREDEKNMAKEETEKQTQHDEKRRPVTIGNDKVTSALCIGNAINLVGRLNSQME